METALQELGNYIASSLSEDVLEVSVAHGELIVVVRAQAIRPVLIRLRDDSQISCGCLVDVTAVDYPQREQRFFVVYNLLSLSLNHRVRVKLTTDEDTPVPSVSDIYSSAGWFEREIWDMFGVYFDNHPDLRRILTDYGFEGHPLRKDFPLTGYVEVRYDEEQKRVIYEPVRLAQDFRNFDFLSPWEGMTTVQSLPGDEKAADKARV